MFFEILYSELKYKGEFLVFQEHFVQSQTHVLADSEIMILRIQCFHFHINGLVCGLVALLLLFHDSMVK